MGEAFIVNLLPVEREKWRRSLPFRAKASEMPRIAAVEFCEFRHTFRQIGEDHREAPDTRRRQRPQL
jgi:hypothetical protein